MSLVFVSTAPVAEPSVVTFTVPLDICTIVVTVVTLYSSSGDFCGPLVLQECLRRDVVWWFFLLVVLTILYGTVWCRFLEISPSIISSTKWMWVCLHAEFLVQHIRHYLRRQYIYFRFKLLAYVAVRSGRCICTAICLGGP